MTNSLDALRYGLPGLAAILALFAFQALRGSPSKSVVSTIRFLVICNLVMFLLVVGADVWNKSMDRQAGGDGKIQFEQERANWNTEKQGLLAQFKASETEKIKITSERDEDKVALKLLEQMQHVIGIFGDVNPEKADDLIKKLHNDYADLQSYRKNENSQDGRVKQLEEQSSAQLNADKKQIQELNDTIASLKSAPAKHVSGHVLRVLLPLNPGNGNAHIAARVTVDNKLYGGITSIHADASVLNIPLTQGQHNLAVTYNAFAWQQGLQTNGNLLLMGRLNQGTIQKSVTLDSDTEVRLAIMGSNLAFLP